MVLVGMAGEYVTALDDNLRFHSMHNAQHITMFAFFLFPVIFDLLHFYRVPGKYTLISLISFIVKSYPPPLKAFRPTWTWWLARWPSRWRASCSSGTCTAGPTWTCRCVHPAA